MEKEILKFLRKEVRQQLNEVKISMQNHTNNIEEQAQIDPATLKAELKDKLDQLSVSLPDDESQLLLLLRAVNNAMS